MDYHNDYTDTTDHKAAIRNNEHMCAWWMPLFIFNQKYLLVRISEAHHSSDIMTLSGFIEVNQT